MRLHCTLVCWFWMLLLLLSVITSLLTAEWRGRSCWCLLEPSRALSEAAACHSAAIAQCLGTTNCLGVEPCCQPSQIKNGSEGLQTQYSIVGPQVFWVTQRRSCRSTECFLIYRNVLGCWAELQDFAPGNAFVLTFLFCIFSFSRKRWEKNKHLTGRSKWSIFFLKFIYC